jgi:hypothetical protein
MDQSIGLANTISVVGGVGLRSLAVALMPLVFCTLSPVARAQSGFSSPATEPQPEPRPANRAQRPRSVADQLDRLTTQLQLTADQQARVKIILDRRQAEMLPVRRADSLTARDRFTKLEAIKRDALEKINALLTDEQRKIFQLSPQRPNGG